LAQQRFYSSDAFPTTLTAALGTTGNPQVASIAGLPASYPFTMLLDWGDPSQEAISVTSAPTGSGPWTLPCTRGIDGSTGGAGGVAHESGASIVHGVTAQDFTQPSVFIDSLTGTAASNFLPAALAGLATSWSVLTSQGTGVPPVWGPPVLPDPAGGLWVLAADTSGGLYTRPALQDQNSLPITDQNGALLF